MLNTLDEIFRFLKMFAEIYGLSQNLRDAIDGVLGLIATKLERRSREQITNDCQVIKLWLEEYFPAIEVPELLKL